jgi:hypothetical protein
MAHINNETIIHCALDVTLIGLIIWVAIIAIKIAINSNKKQNKEK